MAEVNIRNQHYVWRHYLKPWTEDNKIWCVRGDNEPFRINIEKIVKEDYYYRIDRLDKNDKKFMELFLSILPPSSKKIVEKIYYLYNMLSETDDYIRNNAIEKYQSSIERRAMPIIDEIYKNDLSFWKKNIERGNFCHFVGMQYTRTKKIRQNLVTAFNIMKDEPGNPGNIDPEKTGKIISLILADIIGNWIHTNTKPIIIDAKKSSFLTSDQPVYNLKVDLHNPLFIPSEFEIFYPITPMKALFFKPKKIKMYHRLSVDEYNNFIIGSAREYVFSHSKEFIMKYFGKSDLDSVERSD